MIELKIALQPKQKEFLEMIEKTSISFYGGARGGGKSKGLQLIMLLRRFKYPGTTGAIFRRTYPELEANHIRPLFQSYPQLREYYNDSKKLLTLPNGSTIQFSHCNNEADISLYQGREIEDLAIDEIGQWSEGMVRTLSASNRTSKMGYHPKIILAGNPGGIGHGWLKRLFVERRFKERERPEDYGFVRALVYDNDALMEADPGYIARLEAEPNDALRKAWLEGSWDIRAGQYFTELAREIHVISPIHIPRHWNRFGSYDYGFNHPAAFGWFTVDEDGNVYLYRELVQAQLRVDEFCELISAYPDTAQLSQIVAGWDCWAKKGTLQSGSTPTIAEEFLKYNITLSRAKIDRVQGASQVRNYLAWKNLSQGKTEPRFKIFDNCPVSFDALSRMEHDPNHVEDVLKVDATEGDALSGDDAYDMIRYALMSRPLISAPEKIVGKPGSDAWSKFQAKKLEESIDKQIEYEQAQERGEDIFHISGMDDDQDIMSYYINKRKS